MAETTNMDIAANGAEAHTWRHGLRAAVTALLVVLGCVAFSAYVIVRWAERQVFTTDNWVAMVSPWPKQPAVYNALGSFISDRVFENAPIQAEITDALPPKAAFLAGPLTSQLKSLTTQAAQKVVASDGFQSVWTDANRLAMGRLTATARGQTPPLQSKINQKFNLDLSGASGQLSSALGKASTAIPALQPASKQTVALSTNLHAKAERVRQGIRTTDYLATVLPLAVIASFLGALAFARRRRRTAIVFAVTIFALMLAELIAVKWARQSVLDQVRNSANIPAISYIFDSAVAMLKHMINVVIVLALLLTGLLILGGPAEWAVKARSYVHFERLGQTRFAGALRTARTWARHWEYYLWLGAFLFILAGTALFTTVNARVILNALLLILGSFALIHIVATPPMTAREAAPAASTDFVTGVTEKVSGRKYYRQHKV